MRIFLSVLILIFSLQSWTKADDIRDFEIEGMSVGDSLLEYKSLKYIKNTLDHENTFYYKNREYAVITLDISSDLFDSLSATIKPKDKKYIIHAIEGRLIFQNDMEGCKNKKSEIANDILLVFPNQYYKNHNSKHSYDKTGKSLFYASYLKLPTGNIELFCFDWSNELYESERFPDELKLIITSSKFREWVNTKAYE